MDLRVSLGPSVLAFRLQPLSTLLDRTDRQFDLQNQRCTLEPPEEGVGPVGAGSVGDRGRSPSRLRLG